MLTEAELLRQSVASILVKDSRKTLKQFRDRLMLEVVHRSATVEPDLPEAVEDEGREEEWRRET